MLESAAIAEVFDCFHDQLVPCAGFLRAGRVSKNPQVEGIVNVAVQRVLADARLLRSRMIHLPEEHLWHGSFLHDPDMMTTVVFFEDIRLVAVAVGRLSTGRADLFRCALPEEAIRFDKMRLVSVTPRDDVFGEARTWN